MTYPERTRFYYGIWLFRNRKSQADSMHTALIIVSDPDTLTVVHPGHEEENISERPEPLRFAFFEEDVRLPVPR